ncbi:hypothetical protein [Chryseobacterium koreense]
MKTKSFQDMKEEMKRLRKQGVQPYEGVEKNELEEFIKTATKNLVSEMRS